MSTAVSYNDKSVFYKAEKAVVGKLLIRKELPFISTSRFLCFVSNSQYTHTTFERMPAEISDKELTKLCMDISETSLQKEWENEDDDHWASFIKD